MGAQRGRCHSCLDSGAENERESPHCVTHKQLACCLVSVQERG